MTNAGIDDQAPSLLCVANFPAGTGYAWQFLEGLYAAAAEELSRRGLRTLVAFPAMDDAPDRLSDSGAQGVILPVALESPRSLSRLLRFIRRERVRVLYLTDRPAWHPVYPLLRLSGVRRIVVYDHTSGERTPPVGAKRWLKSLSRRAPGTVADKILAVSDYVAERHRSVGLIPARRVQTVRNSIAVPEVDPLARDWLSGELEIPPDRPAIACTARAARYKGVHVLLEAFDQVWRSRADNRDRDRPILVFVGDGPDFANLQALRDRLASTGDILLTGYRTDAARIAGSADLAIVPSVWQEAFGLAVLEPMAHARPVIASAVGGIPEIVEDRSTGLLVPPGDVDALANAIEWALDHPEEARQMGVRGRERAREQFSPEAQISGLIAALTDG